MSQLCIGGGGSGNGAIVFSLKDFVVQRSFVQHCRYVGVLEK